MYHGYYIHFKMAAAHSIPSLKCEVCTATVTLYSKFCATCGAKRDEETQARKYYFNERYKYEVILCFLLKYKPYYLATVTVNTAMDCKTVRFQFIIPINMPTVVWLWISVSSSLKLPPSPSIAPFGVHFV